MFLCPLNLSAFLVTTVKTHTHSYWNSHVFHSTDAAFSLQRCEASCWHFASPFSFLSLNSSSPHQNMEIYTQHLWSLGAAPTEYNPSLVIFVRSVIDGGSWQSDYCNNKIPSFVYSWECHICSPSELNKIFWVKQETRRQKRSRQTPKGRPALLKSYQSRI